MPRNTLSVNAAKESRGPGVKGVYGGSLKNIIFISHNHFRVHRWASILSTGEWFLLNEVLNAV